MVVKEIKFGETTARFTPSYERVYPNRVVTGLKHTIYNQFDSLASSLVTWLTAQQVQFRKGCIVIDIALGSDAVKFLVRELKTNIAGRNVVMPIWPNQ